MEPMGMESPHQSPSSGPTVCLQLSAAIFTDEAIALVLGSLMEIKHPSPQTPQMPPEMSMHFSPYGSKRFPSLKGAHSTLPESRMEGDTFQCLLAIFGTVTNWHTRRGGHL